MPQNVLRSRQQILHLNCTVTAQSNPTATQ